jgi:hypothetical protein
MTTKCSRLLFCGTLALVLAAPVVAWDGLPVNDSEKPGSVLVFPKFIRGTFSDVVTGEVAHARTELEISVACPQGATCANDRVRLRAEWVCAGCVETSFNLETTVGGSLYFNPEGVTVIAGVVTAAAFPNNATTPIAQPPPGCDRGYLIAWVVDGSSNAIKFDGLIGDAVIRDAPGTTNNEFSARSYNAVPIQASDNLRTGDLTDVDGDGALDFGLTDAGYEYLPVTGRIFGTVRYESLVATAPRVETDLTLLTLDVASNRPNPATNVGLNFYTTDEGLNDTSTTFTCWTERRLTDILPSLTTQVMGRKGLVESTYAEQHPDLFTTVPVTLLGIVETKEFGNPGFFPAVQFRDYAYSLYNDGNPVNTAFKP